ncbi:MAG: hypothetical protein RMJ39_09225 [Deltaproteobacteria bacterium]|nr:hypothetical protein [Deltaproteobacteria bacterium]
MGDENKDPKLCAGKNKNLNHTGFMEFVNSLLIRPSDYFCSLGTCWDFVRNPKNTQGVQRLNGFGDAS